ncbi:GDSL esterase/lipase At1g29670-like [Euphorbia lathyris]|uniref:GDSL esterase/lipase At1g29670-like n=1 Tax=Euphorbia lathyris TaxID=212925 RepID=UPI003313E5E4
MENKKSSTSSTQHLSICLSLILAFISPLNCYSKEHNNEGKIKGMFVFGSSLVDIGNNNFLQNSIAKANYLPYGIDFPSGPSGRFTNGKNIIDILGDHLSLPSIPPFYSPSTKGINNIINGVNYASAASGILDDTGTLAGEVISLNKQMKNFEEITFPELEVKNGKKGEELLGNYLFVIGTGGNDYSFNYFLNPSNENVSLEEFTANLTFSLSTQLEKLYSLGGRKFVLMSVNPIGCYPMVKASRGSNKRCIQALNRAAHLFNSHLKSLVDFVNPEMPLSHFVFVNSYKIIRDLIRNPFSKGLKDASNPCCEIAAGGNGSLCKKEGKVCQDRKAYVFFDGLHPTEAVNIIIATKAFNSTLQADAYPINIQHLAML